MKQGRDHRWGHSRELGSLLSLTPKLALAALAGLVVTSAQASPSAELTPAEPRSSQTPAEPEPWHGPSYPFGSGLLQVLPANHLFARYLADPRQPMMKALALHVLRYDTAETDSPLLEFTMGGRYPLLRWHPRGEPDLGWQVDSHAAFLGRFDAPANFDAVGWDGLFGVTVSYRPTQRFALKMAYQHDSAHVADEYIEKTGRERITYTREEVAWAALADPLGWLRSYVELGYGFDLSYEEMLPWRAQLGLELRYLALYAAFDVNFWQEQRWRPTTTLQLGVMSERRATSRRYGVALQFARGRTTLGEFFGDQERTLGVGWWVDL